MFNKEQIVKELKLKSFGSKGWYKGNTSCPECGKVDKFGIYFTEDSGICHCFYDGFKTSLYNYLKLINRRDLLNQDNYTIEQKTSLTPLKKTLEQNEKKEVKLPLGFKRIKHDKYLEKRGFTESDYDKFGVGVAELDPRTENKIVFQIINNNELVGWIARSREIKEWHKENLLRSKEGLEDLVLRYRNSDNDFSEILGGLDDITNKTFTVILVEGLMDKANVDRLMELDKSEDIKCCYTFGSDISEKQVELLLKKENVKEVILFYDNNTINQVKSGGARLMLYYDVRVWVIDEENLDPGSCTLRKLYDIWMNCEQSFLNFFGNLQ